jgi:hypothetical protein
LRASEDEESLTEGLGAGQGGESFQAGLRRVVEWFLKTDETVIGLHLRSFAGLQPAQDDNFPSMAAIPFCLDDKVQD